MKALLKKERKYTVCQEAADMLDEWRSALAHFDDAPENEIVSLTAVGVDASKRKYMLLLGRSK